jgi:hypothetical protein
MADEQPQTKTQPGGGRVEPKPITFVGGPRNGRKVADYGQYMVRDEDGGMYRRVKMDAGDMLGRITFDVLAYWGYQVE